MNTPTFVTLPPREERQYLRPKNGPGPVKLSYSYWSPRCPLENDGEAPLLLFLPSEGTDARSIHREQLTSAVLRDRFHLIALDLRGCGFSLHPLPDAADVEGVDINDVLAQDVVDALPLLPGAPLQRRKDGGTRLFIIGTSVTCYTALRIAAKTGSDVTGVILLSPSSEIESVENAQSFDEMVDAWQMTNDEVVARYPDPLALLRSLGSVRIPLLVSGGFQARLLNEMPWPPKLLNSLTTHWRRRWLSAKGAQRDLELFVHSPCALRTGLGALWDNITAAVLVIRGDVGQPNGNGQEEYLRSKLIKANSFSCKVITGAPLLVSVTHAEVVNNQLLAFCGQDGAADHTSAAAQKPLKGPCVTVSNASGSATPVDSTASSPEAIPSRQLEDEQAEAAQSPSSSPTSRVATASSDTSARLMDRVNRSRTESISSHLSMNSNQSGSVGAVSTTSELSHATTDASLRSILDQSAMEDLRKATAATCVSAHSANRGRTISNVSSTFAPSDHYDGAGVKTRASAGAARASVLDELQEPDENYDGSASIATPAPEGIGRGTTSSALTIATEMTTVTTTSLMGMERGSVGDSQRLYGSISFGDEEDDDGASSSSCCSSSTGLGAGLSDFGDRHRWDIANLHGFDAFAVQHATVASELASAQAPQGPLGDGKGISSEEASQVGAISASPASRPDDLDIFIKEEINVFTE